MKLTIEPTGEVRAIYTEEIDLQALGSMRVRRGSHVEPDEAGKWYADLSPVSGPILGPFPLRSQALAAEIGWLSWYCFHAF